MFGKGKSNLRDEIDYKKIIFEAMIRDIPEFIQKEIEKISLDIHKSSEREGGDDFYEKEHVITDDNGQIVKHIIEYERVADDIERNDHRNQLCTELYEINFYFYYAMVIMLYAYAESSMQKLNDSIEVSKSTKSKLEKIFGKIQRKVPKLSGKCIGDWWKNEQEFHKMRNEITHELDAKNSVKLTPEYMLDNLEDIYSMLDDIREVVENEKKNQGA